MFNSGIPAWRTHVKTSRLDELAVEIEAAKGKGVEPAVGNGEYVPGEKTVQTTTGSHEDNTRAV